MIKWEYLKCLSLANTSYIPDSTVTERKDSLVLKNLEICNKVTHSQTVPSCFGRVGGADALLGGS